MTTQQMSSLTVFTTHPTPMFVCPSEGPVVTVYTEIPQHVQTRVQPDAN